MTITELDALCESEPILERARQLIIAGGGQIDTLALDGILQHIFCLGFQAGVKSGMKPEEGENK